MLSCKAFYEALAARGVTFYAGVPDSLLKDFCAYVTDHTPDARNIIAANEGSAIGLAAGHHFATGEVGLVYMQNSGLGNTVNPLTSLADRDVYGVPMLLVIGWRAEPGVKDEPQHVTMGRVTLEVLRAIGVAAHVLPDDEAGAMRTLDVALAAAREQSAPVALVVKKGTFEPYKLVRKDTSPYETTRERAIELFVESVPKDALVVATTGMPSRELYEIRERRGERHDGDFLTVGSMGHASQIALGLALSTPTRPVYCLDGDGAALMHLGGLATIAQLAPKNYRHFVVNNGAHDSVGGQPTVAFSVDLCGVAKACGYRDVRSAHDEASLRSALASFHAAEGPVLVEARIKKGNRPDLGRPKESPHASKLAFMSRVRG